MKDYQTLIADIRRDERELNDKLTNLEYFMMTEDFTKISPEQKKLLERQHDLMAQYKTVLIQRAHRINYEHAQEKACTCEPEKETKKETEVINCASCRHYRKSTCSHGVLKGLNCWETETPLACASCKWGDTYHENGELVYSCHNTDAEAIRTHECYAPKESNKYCSDCYYSKNMPDGPRCKECDNGSLWVDKESH